MQQENDTKSGTKREKKQSEHYSATHYRDAVICYLNHWNNTGSLPEGVTNLEHACDYVLTKMRTLNVNKEPQDLPKTTQSHEIPGSSPTLTLSRSQINPKSVLSASPPKQSIKSSKPEILTLP